MVNSTSIPESSLANSRFFDESYQNKLNLLHLFLQISKEHLLLTRFDEQSKKYLEFEHYDLGQNEKWLSAQRKLEKILPSSNLQEGKKCVVLISDKIYTLIPKALFDKNKLASYLSFNHPLEEDEHYQFFYDRLESFDAVLVYAIPRALNLLTKAKLPVFKWHHFALPLLEAMHLDKTNHPKLNIHIQHNRFDVIWMPNGKLEFFNSFNYKTTEDFIYYLLYVMEQLQLDRDSVAVKLFGEFEEKSSIYEMLYTYIRNVEIANRPSDVNFSSVLSELPKQYYFNLFNQHLCG